MRQSLAALNGRRTPVVANFAGVGPRGHIILENVRTIAGRERYCWVEFADWKGKLPFPGSEVHFQATVKQYYSEHRGCFDYGLTAIDMEDGR
jgi:hypothetical protein